MQADKPADDSSISACLRVRSMAEAGGKRSPDFPGQGRVQKVLALQDQMTSLQRLVSLSVHITQTR